MGLKTCGYVARPGSLASVIVDLRCAASVPHGAWSRLRVLCHACGTRTGRLAAMWNSLDTAANDAIDCEVTLIAGGNGDQIHAYVARPEGPGPFPGVVLIHHVPGWDEFYREMTRRFAQHGYSAICPDLFCRVGHGTPDDVAAKVRAEGGVPDDGVVADIAAARAWVRALPTSNGKVGVIGTCSRGRHAVLVASRVKGFD